MSRHSPSRSVARGFSLIELIIVIAILSILSSIVVMSVTNASRDSRRVMARQQQGALNSAVGAWVGGQSRSPTTGQLQSTSTIQGIWNTGYTSNKAKLNAIVPYLDAPTADDFVTNSTNGDKVQSSAMTQDTSWISFPFWATDGSPEVKLNY
jgi:prepilin-type N-terminal cleavage/methylation domain-containing protein